MKLKIPEKALLKKIFGTIGGLLLAAVFVKAFFLSILIVLAYGFHFLGISVSAGWLIGITAAGFVAAVVKREAIIDFYISLWNTLRDGIERMIRRRQGVTV